MTLLRVHVPECLWSNQVPATCSGPRVQPSQNLVSVAHFHSHAPFRKAPASLLEHSRASPSSLRRPTRACIISGTSSNIQIHRLRRLLELRVMIRLKMVQQSKGCANIKARIRVLLSQQLFSAQHQALKFGRSFPAAPFWVPSVYKEALWHWSSCRSTTKMGRSSEFGPGSHTIKTTPARALYHFRCLSSWAQRGADHEPLVKYLNQFFVALAMLGRTFSSIASTFATPELRGHGWGI